MAISFVTHRNSIAPLSLYDEIIGLLLFISTQPLGHVWTLTLKLLDYLGLSPYGPLFFLSSNLRLFVSLSNQKALT